jgi:hypothetical protein
MAYLTVEQFKDTLANDPLASITQQHIFGGTPYVFRHDPEYYDLLIGHVRQGINVLKENIIVVGSAKTGFSLNPDNFPREFSETSDIDVVVVSPELFDRVWLILLAWHYPRRLVNLGAVEGNWARLRRKDIYWGWFVPDQIRYEGISFPEALKPLRDFSVTWFDTFQSLSLLPEFGSRTVSGRLYRTWEHALRYHVEGLRMIRHRIFDAQKGV